MLNCTIDRYAYAFIAPRTDGRIVFKARDLNLEETHDAGVILNTSDGLRLHRGVYNNFFRQARSRSAGFTLTTTVDAPAGSGLGSSSALVVAMCEAFSVAFDVPLGLYDLAHLAYRIERIDLALAGGKQDQYAAAFGGINFVEFLANDRVIVNPLRIDRAILNELETSLVVCFSGLSRASEVIQQQMTNMTRHNASALDALFHLKAAAGEMKEALLLGNIRAMGEILNRSWISKKMTSDAVSSDFIENLFRIGRDAGAAAGKISGAGGGGFIMFLVNPEDRIAVIEGLNHAGGRAGPVHLTSRGVESWREPLSTRAAGASP